MSEASEEKSVRTYDFWPNRASVRRLKSQFRTLKPARKNLGLVAAMVNMIYHEAVANKKPLVVRSKTLANLARSLGWADQWTLNDNTDDEHGLARAIGDCLGDHDDALRLEKIQANKGWTRVIPSGGITNEFLISRGIDPKSCQHPLLKDEKQN